MSSDESAFPYNVHYATDTEHKKLFLSGNGLTKRELFAAMAMQGLCSSFDYLRQLDKKAQEKNVGLEASVAIASISYADALIKALEEKK